MSKNNGRAGLVLSLVMGATLPFACGGVETPGEGSATASGSTGLDFGIVEIGPALLPVGDGGMEVGE